MKRTLLSPVLSLVVFAFSAGIVRGGGEAQIVAVSSKVSPDYVRTKNADGTFTAETFAFGNGGHLEGSANDSTIDKVTFEDVAKTIVAPLATQNYLSTKDAKTTKLLIMVFWGATTPLESTSTSVAMENAQKSSANLNAAQMAATQSSNVSHRSASNNDLVRAENEVNDSVQMVALENRQRDLADFNNARILGFDEAWNATANFEGTPFESKRQDLVLELEESRYFVVLMAYDFQLLWKEKKRKLLWETRFSVQEHGNAFNQQLAAITAQASRYFGQDSKGLIRKPLPVGHVETGELKVLDAEPQK